jgi:pyruvate dehydrogenase E2 component (dihydrolipoamide acetyltransferase)
VRVNTFFVAGNNHFDPCVCMSVWGGGGIFHSLSLLFLLLLHIYTNIHVDLFRFLVLCCCCMMCIYCRGLDATVLTGSGKGGRVTKGDVMAAIRDGTPMPALSVHETIAAPLLPKAVAATGAAVAAVPSSSLSSTIIMADLPLPPIDSYGTYADFANNNMRKVIARRLTESKRGVPHYYTSVEVELDNVMKLRKVLVNDHGIKISVNDVIIKCCSLALRDVPEVNGTYDPKTDTVKLQDSIDVSVAVATPTGLITPIVPHTDTLGLAEITDKIRDLATRARDGKLKPEEYQGGTFCVSNLGMFGIDEFSAVINPPQAAILAVGGGSKRIVPTPYIDGVAVQKKPSIRTIMTARLSADRRVVDEATAALFMSAFKHYITKPELLLL